MIHYKLYPFFCQLVFVTKTILENLSYPLIENFCNIHKNKHLKGENLVYVTYSLYNVIDSLYNNFR